MKPGLRASSSHLKLYFSIMDQVFQDHNPSLDKSTFSTRRKLRTEQLGLLLEELEIFRPLFPKKPSRLKTCSTFCFKSFSLFFFFFRIKT